MLTVGTGRASTFVWGGDDPFVGGDIESGGGLEHGDIGSMLQLCHRKTPGGSVGKGSIMQMECGKGRVCVQASMGV